MADKQIFLNNGASTVDVPKSTFDKSFTNHLSARFGRLYPCLVEEAVPGSSYKIRPDMAFDMMPMQFPLQSRMRVHFSLFKVPFRILWPHVKDFFTRVGDHQMPYISRSDDWTAPGSLADYMGVPSAQVNVVSRMTSLPWHRSGFIHSIEAENLVLNNRRRFSLDNFHLYTYPDDYFGDSPDVSVSNPNYINIISEPFEHPLDSNTLSFSTLSSDNGAISASVGVYLDLVVERKEYSGRRNRGLSADFHIVGGTSSTRRFAIVNSNLSAGKILQGSVYQLSNRILDNSVYFRNYKVKFTDDDVEAINSFIMDEQYNVRLRMTYSTDIAQYFGVTSMSRGFDPFNGESIRNWLEDKDGVLEVVREVMLSSSLSYGITYQASVGSVERNRKYFNLQEGDDAPALPINALPFRAYEFIYNKFFRNVQVAPFYKNGVPTYNEYLTNDGDGADSTTPVDFFNVPYEYDQFTTALLSPQAGFAPLVGVTTNDESTLGMLHMVPMDETTGQPKYEDAYDIGVNIGQDSSITGISNYDEVANKSSVHRLSELIDFGISINDLRNVSAFQRFKEKLQKAGYEYEPYHREFFGTVPPIGEEFPEYIGGCSRDVMVGKIQNTALSNDHALGEFAGVGGVNADAGTLRVYCAEHSYLIGLMWFSVTPVYSQMLPKHFLKSHPLDYFNPIFNSVGPQPVMRHEIAPLQLASDELMDVFGYQRPWYDYVSRVDEAHGLFRTTLRNYILQRIFLDAPELTEAFINIHHDDLTDVFTVTEGTDKFWGFIRFDMKVKQPIARVSVPRIIG